MGWLCGCVFACVAVSSFVCAFVGVSVCLCGVVGWLCECVWVCVCVLCVVVSFVALVEVVFVSLCLAQPPIIISMASLAEGGDVPFGPTCPHHRMCAWLSWVSWLFFRCLVCLVWFGCLGGLSWLSVLVLVLVVCLGWLFVCAWVVRLWLCLVAGVRLCLLPCVGESSPVAFSSASVVSSPCLFASMLFPSWPAVHMHLQ